MSKNSLITDRKGTWYENYRIDKKSVRRSLAIPVKTGSKETDKQNKATAEKIAAKNYNDLLNLVHLNIYKHSWEQAAEEYIIHRREEYDILEQDNPNIKHLIRKHHDAMNDVVQKFEVVDRFLAGKDINDICQTDLKKIRRHVMQTRNCKHKTANRYLAQVRSTLIRCRDKLQNADKTPWLRFLPAFPITAENDERLVSLSPEKFWELYHALPDLHQDMMLVAVSSGIRDTPLRLMQKEWLFLDSETPTVIIPGIFQKNKEPLGVPLPQVAINSIKRAIARNPESEHIFNTDHYGKPLKKASTSGWYRALDKVGLKGKFKWHDLRHVFAATHVLNGTPESVIQRLGGWKTPSMVTRYAHTDAGKLHGFTDCFDAYLTHGDNGQKAKSGKSLISK